jgi:hypothetical protein
LETFSSATPLSLGRKIFLYFFCEVINFEHKPIWEIAYPLRPFEVIVLAGGPSGACGIVLEGAIPDPQGEVNVDEGNIFENDRRRRYGPEMPDRPGQMKK